MSRCIFNLKQGFKALMQRLDPDSINLKASIYSILAALSTKRPTLYKCGQGWVLGGGVKGVTAGGAKTQEVWTWMLGIKACQEFCMKYRVILLIVYYLKTTQWNKPHDNLAF